MNTDHLSGRRTFYIVAYNLLLILLMAGLLYSKIMGAAHAEAAAVEAATAKAPIAQKVPAKVPAPVVNGNTTTPDTTKAPDTAASETEVPAPVTTLSAAPHAKPAEMIAYVLWAISLAGGLGGALSNMRGFFEHYRDKSYFPAYLEIPFYIRPVSGILCGLFTFFVSTFFAGALAANGEAGGWKSFEGMFPYIGIAFIAGFASQEFMERLKETAKTLFGVPTTSNNDTEPPPPDTNTPPATPPAPEAPPANQDGGEESFKVEEEGDSKSAVKTVAPPPPSQPTPPPVTPPPPPAAPPTTRGRRAD
jgi:hypothetical protein